MKSRAEAPTPRGHFARFWSTVVTDGLGGAAKTGFIGQSNIGFGDGLPMDYAVASIIEAAEESEDERFVIFPSG